MRFPKNKCFTRLLSLLLSLLLILGGLSLTACSEILTDALDLAVDLMEEEIVLPTEGSPIDEDGWYTDKEHVALYLWTYHRLPDNFMTKAQARNLGWESGSLEKYAPGCAIGGDRFGNYEGQLPEKKGRTWYECDTGYKGKKRGATRLLFSSDGLYYYTDDHYNTFTQMYPEGSK